MMDRLFGMEVFVTVVEEGSFRAAADRLGLSAPMVGKYIRALEARLGTSVLARTTRRQRLMEEGRLYYERSKVILDQVRLAESNAGPEQEMPRGLLRISATVSFGSMCLAPALVDYLAAYPDMSAELILNDRVVDLMDDGFDVAFRVGRLAESRLVAKPLAPYSMLIAAAPAYLERAGVPLSPAELSGHQCLGFTHWRHDGGWRLGGLGQAGEEPVPMSRFVCNHGPALRMAALQGFGLVMQPRVLLAADVAAGRLVPVLEAALPPPMPLHLVFLQGRQQLPKMRSFIDFMVERFSVSLGLDLKLAG